MREAATAEPRLRARLRTLADDIPVRSEGAAGIERRAERRRRGRWAAATLALAVAFVVTLTLSRGDEPVRSHSLEVVGTSTPGPPLHTPDSDVGLIVTKLATSGATEIASPVDQGEVVPARQAYSHCASLGKRNCVP